MERFSHLDILEFLNSQPPGDGVATATESRRLFLPPQFSSPMIEIKEDGVLFKGTFIGCETEELELLKELYKKKINSFGSAMLRKLSNSEVVYHSDETSAFPQHPNHHREWHSKNLKCASHKTGAIALPFECPLDGAPCCAFIKHFLILEDPRATEESKAKSIDFIHDIEIWLGEPYEEDTFLECTGCHRFVCPACIGICPNEDCQDRLCVRCKSPADLWEQCAAVCGFE